MRLPADAPDARLVVHLVGPMSLALDDASLTAFHSDKARALLAFLAVECDRSHRRDALVGLLWPDAPNPAALRSLRQVLADLRRLLGDAGDADVPPFLRVDRLTLQLHPDARVWIDVSEFETCVTSAAPQHLERALNLYRGPFLADFALKDSAPFEDWATTTRIRLHRQATDAARRLVPTFVAQGDCEAACRLAQRWVEIDPASERAHRELMHLLALTDRRSAALAQYDRCCQLLHEILDVKPGPKTIQLYESIRRGSLAAPLEMPAAPLPAPPTPPPPPAFLTQEVPVEQPVFVAREQELAQLDAALRRALRGQGHVVWVTGEAGLGKTALMRAFAARAQDTFPDLVVADGQCAAYTGAGEPYLPFREILAQLTGDVEARWAAGAMTRDQALRLWRTFPVASDAIATHGPDLIDTFLHGTALANRARVYRIDDGGSVARIRELVAARNVRVAAGAPPPPQEDLLEQVSAVLQAMTRYAPLLLLIDDLQWVDSGSASLLFHLGMRLPGSRILLLGAYRPEEVARRRDGALHPLCTVVRELSRRAGDSTVDLAQTEGRAFVEALLDYESNRLDRSFRDTLFRRTEGHPLFTIEMLRGMQTRGDLIRGPDGQWVIGSQLDWNSLPARAEAAIAARIERLSIPLRETMRVAAVEGEIFTAEAVAQVLNINPPALLSRLSDELGRRHQLIQAEGVARVGDQQICRYRFRHILFQNYLYSTLDPVERIRFHAGIGMALETLYGEQTADVAVQLARHFETAGHIDRAVCYLQSAGDRAVRLSANAEAIELYNHAIRLLTRLPDTHERARVEIDLQLALAAPVIAVKSWGAAEAVAAYDRAVELGEQMKDKQKLLRAILMKEGAHTVHAQHDSARTAADRVLVLAQDLGDPINRMLGYQAQATTRMFVGDFTGSLRYAHKMLNLYNPQLHTPLIYALGQDVSITARVWMVYDLWFLGYQDTALRTSEEALTYAETLDHPMSLLFIRTFKCRMHHWRRDVAEVASLCCELRQMGEEHNMQLGHAARIWEGWATAQRGQLSKAIDLFVEGYDLFVQSGMRNHLTEFNSILAEIHARAGRFDRAIDLVEQMLERADATGEAYFVAELHRQRGALILQADPDAETQAEAAYRDAVAAARAMKARMCELRALTSLCRLRSIRSNDAGRAAARAELARVYQWFTEGFDTQDLKEAREALQSLSVA